MSKRNSIKLRIFQTELCYTIQISMQNSKPSKKSEFY